MQSEVKEGMTTIRDVLHKHIQEAINKYKKEKEIQLANLTSHLEEVKKILLLHRVHRDRLIKKGA